MAEEGREKRKAAKIRSRLILKVDFGGDLELNSEFFDFLVVVLAIEDRPFLGAFDDGAALALDFLTSGLVDAGFLHEKLFENLADFEADGVAVLDELDLIQIGYRVGDHMGEFVDFVAAQAHGRGVLILSTCS
jgi:hypothetical protein